MARSTPATRARAALIGLLVLVLGMGGLLTYGATQGKAQWAPLLALDLSGGTQMVLSPHTEGDEQLDDEQLEQAVEIIRQRVDGSGVSEAEIATQGDQNVVVSMPGSPDAETRELIQASADMQFRPVLQTGTDPEYMQQLLDEDDEDDSVLTDEQRASLEAQVAQAGDSEEEAQPSDFEEPDAEPENASDPNWITPQLAARFENHSCSRDLSVEERTEIADDEPLISCDPKTGRTYLLGPLEVSGTHLDDAGFGMERGPQGDTTGGWAVNLSFDDTGAEQFHQVTQRLTALEGARNQFAIVLDGQVVSAPGSNAVITDGNAEITGSFTEDEARGLSEQLRYGSLPISFSIESEQQISATLGADQLRYGLIAGIIGLVLVAGYALVQYRALGLVTISSLVVAGVLTWWAIALLGWSDGYRLSLAGISGLIVSIGLTADSFIVYFERIKDELREGRSLAGSVESGWARARRTILASKAVNLIAAVVLYLVAVGNVRGFAFTLGLTALIDVILVFLFTHPLMQLLARRRFFASGRRFSGLSEDELGVEVLYRGAGRFRSTPRTPTAAEPASAATPEAEPAPVPVGAPAGAAGPEGESAAADPESGGDPAGDRSGGPAAPRDPAREETGTSAEAPDETAAEAPDETAAESQAEEVEAVEETEDEVDWSSLTIAERRRLRRRRAGRSRTAGEDEEER
ncbi:protein translocase subunit SecD [Nesterenkonia sp. F]|uniref:protein translocase subunit SecD n=1 Tax=Nesterenkonia sp. F TaxID=795955 RepID=UPI000255C7F7|nr:protein translocase subunit SecD [Nesterenkonia sp. F]